MAWTTPKTWNDGDVLTAAELNEQVRDNLNFLFDKPGAISNLDEAANYTTTSTTFVDIDATDLSKTITTSGGDVLIWFSAFLRGSARIAISFNIEHNGSVVAGEDGIQVVQTVDSLAISALGTGNYAYISFVYLIEAPAAGSNTFKMQWKQSNATQTATMYAGAGTTDADVHPQFGVREL